MKTKQKLIRCGYDIDKGELQTLEEMSSDAGHKGKVKPFVENLIRTQIKEFIENRNNK